MIAAQTDFVAGGRAFGGVAEVLLANNFDVNALRPWYNQRTEKSYVARRAGWNDDGSPVYNAQPVYNAPATLRKDQWKAIDTQIIRVAKERLVVFNDLRGVNTFSIGAGMGKTVLEYEKMSDITPATVSMDAIRQGDSDRPVFDLGGLPLPIVHRDFRYSLRQIMASRQDGGTPLDTSGAELATEKVAEKIDSMTLGEVTAFTYAGYSVYGYKTFPDRLTKTLTAPTGSNNATVVTEVLEMRQQAYDAGYYGPFIVYCSPNWDQYLDTDYSSTKGDNTLRDRLLAINGITDVRTADKLTGTTLILAQQTSNVGRAVEAMDFTTVQWESEGGMQFNFKVMAILVPQFRSDYDGNTGIVHGSV